MNFLDRMPRPDGDHRYYNGDGPDVLYVLFTLFGLALLVLAIAALVVLLWNSFKVRAEVRALSAEVSTLRASQGAVGSVEASADAMGVARPPSTAEPVTPADAPAAPPVKPKRAPRKRPTEPPE
jgi:hypothetical protein